MTTQILTSVKQTNMPRIFLRLLLLVIGFIAIGSYAKNAFGNVIGDVIMLEGNGVIDRQANGETDKLEIDLDVFSNDTVKTGNGKTAIEFIDQTRVDVTQHSKLLIDDFVYDPNTKTGSLSLKATLGTVRYASGQIAKTSQQNVIIKTPTATIGVRGTDFSMTIDELGSSTIILLPSCNINGMCYVGEIEVESDAGFVVMNQAFQATVVDTSSSRPMRPVILDLNEEMIGNLLIISKPSEIQEEQDAEAYNQVANALDIDFLQFDDLEIDYLEDEEDTWATGLDIDFLEQNFLVDVLDQINKELAKQMASSGLNRKRTDTSGIPLGKDPTTGIIILDEEPQWVYAREGPSNYFELRLDKEYGYIISFVQGDFESYDFELGGQDGAIRIFQSN